ncbi:protein-disulfide reductase DsbD family protein [Leclercia sp. UBA2479]|uniref:protein-disulfide reductase DsbD family protein n=1 Tax=Leclercia sp. UBA2479 TaxID=1946738 RepID=UPI00257B874E|nr:protein-disulfide reductase DsbD domain-containing protein [Leclercia sp. UBA2479]
MLTVFRRLLVCLALLWLPVSWAADSGWLRAADNDHASVRLRAQPAEAGETHLLLDVALEKGWKTYWRSPGEGGIAPSIAWQTPLPVQWYWPTPQRFDVAGIATQGYQGNVTFPLVVKGKMPDTLAGVLTLSTCSDVCILTDYPFSLNLSGPTERQFTYDFTKAMGTLPREDGLTSSLKAAWAPGKLTVTATRDTGWHAPALYLDGIEDADFARPTFKIQGETLTAIVPVTDGWGEAAPDLRGKTLSLVLADGGLAQQSQTTIGEAEVTTSSLLPVLAMALLGGFILNLMPCVLPVLAMKLGSVLQVEGQTRSRVRGQFLASVAGIVVSFLALALMMTFLRLSNQALGWGIQFQNPWFIAAMALVMVLFSASLLGLFEIRLPSGITTSLATRGGNGLAGHFWQGAFATLLATPCTAPFLGTAVSVALVAPLVQLWGIFLAMGIGMSLPWLAIAAWPGLARRLPRPGRWMNTLRVVLGLMMLGSAVWLISLLWLHIGKATWGVLALVLVLLLAGVWRRYQRRGALAATALALLMALSGYWLTSQTTGAVVEDRIAWQPLSEQAITDALAANKRVFVDVTADWCVTCKANKYNVLLRDDVQQALSAPDVVALRGDWSRPSDTVSQFLTRRQSAAVPFNQIYGPAQPQGTILPALLNREGVLNVLSAAKGEH